MQRPKLVAIVLLLGALAGGFGLGYGVARARPDNGRRDVRDRLAADLELASDQRRRMDSILDARDARMNEVLRPVRPQTDSLMQHARAAIRATLTPEQQRRFDAYLARQDRRRDRDRD